MLLRAVILVLRCMLVASVCLPAHAARTVTVLLSEPAGIYQDAARALQNELTRVETRDAARYDVRFLHVDERPNLLSGQDGLIVSLGVRALKYALEAPGSAPVLALLVPSLTYDKLIAELPQTMRRRTISALFLDQPYPRQMQLIRHALPEARRVGVLVGPATAQQGNNIKNAGRESGLDVRIQAIQSRESLFAALNDMAREVDVLLLLPDPQVVSGETLRTLLLQTYRLRLPIVAYAASLVQAGATLGLFATPAQMGAEAGKWIREMDVEKGWIKAMTRFPQRYTVEVNRNVARTLQLTLPSVESLNAQLDAERRP
jgi:putative ABC transport system substrate-binding protein